MHEFEKRIQKMRAVKHEEAQRERDAHLVDSAKMLMKTATLNFNTMQLPNDGPKNSLRPIIVCMRKEDSTDDSGSNKASSALTGCGDPNLVRIHTLMPGERFVYKTNPQKEFVLKRRDKEPQFKVIDKKDNKPEFKVVQTINDKDTVKLRVEIMQEGVYSDVGLVVHDAQAKLKANDEGYGVNLRNENTALVAEDGETDIVLQAPDDAENADLSKPYSAKVSRKRQIVLLFEEGLHFENIQINRIENRDGNEVRIKQDIPGITSTIMKNYLAAGEKIFLTCGGSDKVVDLDKDEENKKNGIVSLPAECRFELKVKTFEEKERKVLSIYINREAEAMVYIGKDLAVKEQKVLDQKKLIKEVGKSVEAAGLDDLFSFNGDLVGEDDDGKILCLDIDGVRPKTTEEHEAEKPPTNKNCVPFFGLAKEVSARDVKDAEAMYFAWQMLKRDEQDLDKSLNTQGVKTKDERQKHTEPETAEYPFRPFVWFYVLVTGFVAYVLYEVLCPGALCPESFKPGYTAPESDSISPPGDYSSGTAEYSDYSSETPNEITETGEGETAS